MDEPARAIRPLTSQERESAVARLSTAFAQDVLSMEEFERRVAEAYKAPTPAALARLVENLPVASSPASPDAATPVPSMKPRLAVVFGSNVQRASRVVVPPSLELHSIVGNIELDLREAEFAPGITEIYVRSILGNVEIRLPAHVAIENLGQAILGNFEVRVCGVGRAGRVVSSPGRPVLRIRGRAILGNIEFERDAEPEG